jgi:hypothetical protein
MRLKEGGTMKRLRNPWLIYDYEVILDGKTLSRPCNKVLLRILPPEGVRLEDWISPVGYWMLRSEALQ